MVSPADEFFDAIGRRKHEPMLENVTGTIRFDLMQGVCTEHWLVSISRGDISVSRDMAGADSYLRADRDLFDRVARGEDYLLAALIRGAVVAEGNLELPVLFEKLFPGPAGATQPSTVAGAGRRHT
jgi:SCP-2 sterol transfer family